MCAIYALEMSNFQYHIVVSIILFFLLIPHARAQELVCCDHATGHCQSTCKNTSLIDIVRNERLQSSSIEKMLDVCPSELISFWVCLNSTLKDLSKSITWWGHQCCYLAVNINCRRLCVKAESVADVVQACRRSDEILFYACVDTKPSSHRCCLMALNQDCQQLCDKFYELQSPISRIHRQQFRNICTIKTANRIMNCFKKLKHSIGSADINKQTYCCSLTNTTECRNSCERTLIESETVNEIIDSLQTGGCGPPLPQNRFWQCLLKNSESLPTDRKQQLDEFEDNQLSRIERLGMDGTKWHCCQLSTTTHCRTLCSETFGRFWTSRWNEFNLKCLNQPEESALQNCIEDVEEPCELGCSGLEFCSHYNGRHTDLFRACTSVADQLARNDASRWHQRAQFVIPGNGIALPLKIRKSNDDLCSFETWQKVSCMLHVKPCTINWRKGSNDVEICRESCIMIMSKCVEWSNVTILGINAMLVCSNLTQRYFSDSCIQIKQELVTVPGNTRSNKIEQVIAFRVIDPCRSHPCKSDEVCIANKQCNTSEVPNGSCTPYQCVPGCRIGEVGEYVVPDGMYLRLPIINKDNPGCFKVCKCSLYNIEACQPLLCVNLVGCSVQIESSQVQQFAHGESFYIDCNRCSCFAGEVICTRKQCSVLGTQLHHYPLPCNCPRYFGPVCGNNGITYQTSCLAKCAGLKQSDFALGQCRPNNCANVICPVGFQCVEKPQVCLSTMIKQCSQYVCELRSRVCPTTLKSTLCHNDVLESSMDDSTTFVCGINGQTYKNKANALADLVPIDYPGSCRFMGLMSVTETSQCGVICPPLLVNNCFGITPPGACCFQCGGALRILFSRKQIDRAVYALSNRTDLRVLSLQEILLSLDRHVKVQTCRVFGYVTMELDIFVLVQNSAAQPSWIDLQMCVLEAEKLASLINSRSSRITLELGLSSLISAEVVHIKQIGSGSSSITYSSIIIIILPLQIYLIMPYTLLK